MSTADKTKGDQSARDRPTDRDLDKALKDTFPASDPVSVGEPTGAEVAHGGGPARPGEPIKPGRNEPPTSPQPAPVDPSKTKHRQDKKPPPKR